MGTVSSVLKGPLAVFDGRSLIIKHRWLSVWNAYVDVARVIRLKVYNLFSSAHQLSLVWWPEPCNHCDSNTSATASPKVYMLGMGNAPLMVL